MQSLTARLEQDMRAARSLEPVSFTPTRTNSHDDAVAVLGEIVAHLAERIEILETREQLGRHPVSAARSRHRKSS